MKNFVRLEETPRVKPAWLVTAGVAVVVALAGGAGIAAVPAGAAPAVEAGNALNQSKKPAFKRPEIKQGALKIKGTNASDKLALRLQAGNPGTLQVDVGDDGSADFNFNRADIATIAVDAGAGDDLVRIDEINGVFTDTIPTTIDGGEGNDNIAGGSGAEDLLGGSGDDSIDGNKGADVGQLGAGDDTFIWDPGDGSDIVEGQAGSDTLLFNGAGAGALGAEHIDLSANGTRLKLFRDIGNVTMDTDGVEQVDINALGGADVVTVNNLAGTDVTGVKVDFAGTLGGVAGDGQADRVIVNATDGDDTINVDGDAGGVKVSGLAATVEVLHSEAANDRLEINTLAGRDSVDSGDLAAGVIQLFVDGVLVP